MEQADRLLTERRALWNRYHEGLAALESRELCRRPIVPADCEHNAHLYYLLLPDIAARNSLMSRLKAMGVQAPFHYVPLHDAPAGIRFGRTSGSLRYTEDLASRLVRLPLWYGMTDEPEQVIDAIQTILE
jgi:dTDP-4-amino-4,6-dideoxygalactose transaminase